MICHAEQSPVEGGGILYEESFPICFPRLFHSFRKLKISENAAFDLINRDAK
ncbi:hypothetical protein LPU83_pLPU83c_0457 (plasmid) [Rhizobium favelukesii]|uniref:Uncharacterized protein n=1 Tax=Rhizobium favelukesii TaxID=348824 RepID=W6RJL3_9HYPH|nr:hypothetical protein LPU83_pLPU83c_0457 [Rhizobium favelukesii]